MNDLTGPRNRERLKVDTTPNASTTLGPNEVCACLDETGERKVRVYERCERCGQFMESDLPEDMEALRVRVQELEAALDRLRFKPGVDCWCSARDVLYDEGGNMIEDDFSTGHQSECRAVREVVGGAPDG